MRALLLFSLVFWSAVVAGLWFIGVFGGNLRTVVPGILYRSAQLTGPNLAGALDSTHTRTVINLRGAGPGDEWYENETRLCQARGVQHLDIGFSATHLPPPDQLVKLLKAMDTARYPVLLHCRGGADRSGLAATIYMQVYQHESLDRAEAENLTLRYGHFRWGKARTMNQFFDLYRKSSGGMDLRQWMVRKYPALYREAVSS